MLGLSSYGCCQAERAREEGGQEVAPSQRALAGEAGHCQSHDGPHGGGGVCNEARRAPGGQRQAQAEEGTEHPKAAQQKRKEASKLPIQPPHRVNAGEEVVRTAHTLGHFQSIRSIDQKL